MTVTVNPEPDGYGKVRVVLRDKYGTGELAASGSTEALARKNLVRAIGKKIADLQAAKAELLGKRLGD